MHTTSTQGHSRLSIFFSLTGFIGCGLFSLFYFYKESEPGELLAQQAKEIKALESAWADRTGGLLRLAVCGQAADRRPLFHRNQATGQEYRTKANVFLILSGAVPVLTLAIARWCYWLLTGRFRQKKEEK